MNDIQLHQYNQVKEQIRLIFQNLLIQAIKHSEIPTTYDLNSYASAVLKIDGLAIIDKNQTTPASSPTINQEYHDGYDEAIYNLDNAGFKRVILHDGEK